MLLGENALHLSCVGPGIYTHLQPSQGCLSAHHSREPTRHLRLRNAGMEQMALHGRLEKQVEGEKEQRCVELYTLEGQHGAWTGQVKNDLTLQSTMNSPSLRWKCLIGIVRALKMSRCGLKAGEYHRSRPSEELV